VPSGAERIALRIQENHDALALIRLEKEEVRSRRGDQADQDHRDPDTGTDPAEEHRHGDERKERCRGAEIRLNDDQPDRQSDDSHGHREGTQVQIGAIIRVEEARQHQRREDLHEFRGLELEPSEANPRSYVGGDLA
jgi:hypothetical protein